jgi:hypothetical protein
MLQERAPIVNMDFFANLAFQAKLALGMWKPHATMRYIEEITVLSIHTGAQYATLQKHFSHPSLVINIFYNPTHNLKQGLQMGGKY